MLVKNPEHHPNGDFAITSGLLSEDGNPKYTYSGIGIYDPALFSGLAAEAMPLKPILMKAIDAQQASGEIYTGQWSDIGTVERLNALSKQLNC